jgi:hypothetical protein
LMINAPCAGPFAFGVKVTLMTHVAEGLTVPPSMQVFPLAMAKLPLMETVLRFRGVVPVFSESPSSANWSTRPSEKQNPGQTC